MRRLLLLLLALALAIDVPVQHDAAPRERQRGAADARVLVRQVLDVLCARQQPPSSVRERARPNRMYANPSIAMAGDALQGLAAS